MVIFGVAQTLDIKDFFRQVIFDKRDWLIECVSYAEFVHNIWILCAEIAKNHIGFDNALNNSNDYIVCFGCVV